MILFIRKARVVKRKWMAIRRAAFFLREVENIGKQPVARGSRREMKKGVIDGNLEEVL